MNRYFWCGGADGRLHILRCGTCRFYIHPYLGRCPKCGSDAVAPEAVSGLGEVVAVTVNVQPWHPGVDVPYVIALVALEEQRDIRLVTNIAGYPVEQVQIGTRVRVTFEQHGDIYLPLFDLA